MKRKSAAVQQQERTESLHPLIIDSIQSVKGKKILKLDLRHLDDAPVDYFILCSGDSSTQVKAIADRIEKRLREDADERPLHVEGSREGHWILLDYFNTIVHIFYPETRSFYDLESLWSDAKFQHYETL
ncbi:MAG: ribosome silencing factor [Saprospiraceae bacterium]|nr:ribosome silencing factor [Saprospiraceae bacterium]